MVLREGTGGYRRWRAVGLLGAVAMSRVLASLVFGVSALDPRVLASAAMFMTVVAAFAAYLPAHRATSVEPSSVLQ